ncbi:MAG: crosslink repair DNA glycosylase YcaQ family protein [Pseudomonadota bacterium]
MLTVTNRQARQVILHLQGLTRPPNQKFGPGELLAMIEQLGFVQVDSIQWVERAQHMILAARSQAYRPRDLKRLLEKDRSLFEHWTHDASVIPTQFYAYWKHRFTRHEAKVHAKFSNWQGEGFLGHCPQLMEHIRDHGAVRSRDLDKPQKAESARLDMWQWHDGKAALEFLWRTGKLAISGRDGFQKIYDLPERVLTKNMLGESVSHDGFVDWACRSALDRLGFGTPGDIARYWDLIGIKEAAEWVERHLALGDANNTLRTIDVVGHEKTAVKTLVARADIESVIANLPPVPDRVRALSPFDPVIRDRKRLEWLFGYEYRIEIYVPETKRRWGYYVFPLLEADRLIGRIDMRARRSHDQLEVKRVWLEKGVRFGPGRKARLDGELLRQARLANVKKIVWLDGAEPD